MKRYFFITGHQRSRTGWMSNLFNGFDNTFCHHDATRMMDPPDLMSVMDSKKIVAPVIGDSDNGLPLFPEALAPFRELDPALPVVIIRRNPEEVRASLRRLHDKLNVTDKQIDASIEKTELGLTHIAFKGAKEVAFEDLDDLDLLDEVAQHLLGRDLTVMERQRAGYMRMMNVQMQQPWYDRTMSPEFCKRVKAIIEEEF